MDSMSVPAIGIFYSDNNQHHDEGCGMQHAQHQRTVAINMHIMFNMVKYSMQRQPLSIARYAFMTIQRHVVRTVCLGYLA